MQEPIFLTPVCKDYLWGGNRLREEFGKKSDADKIAETWEFATHKDGNSTISSGAYKGMSLSEYLQKINPNCLGTNCKGVTTLPVLIKLIDAKQDLSIQVHPNNEYGMRVEGEPGKTEMWYILDCTPHAALYYGVNRAVTPEEFAERIENQTLTEILNRVEVKPGELYFIPSGTIHAIGAGILLAEIQQNSNTTYRVYDYGRRGADGKLRELHVEKAKEVSNLSPISPTLQYPEQDLNGATVRKLESCEYFSSDVYTVSKQVENTVSEASFHHLLFTSGTGVLMVEDSTYPVQKGDSVFLPAGFGAYSVAGKTQFILTKIDA